MKPEIQKQSVKLDWTRLLGFDQAAPADSESATKQPRDPRSPKIGNKPGLKVGAKGT